MVNFLRKNPLLIPAILVAIILYCGIVRCRVVMPFMSLAPKNDIILLKGRVISNPIKCGSENRTASYRFMVKATSCTTKNNVIHSARGQIPIYISANLFEAYYPGKLWTSSEKMRGTNASPFLIENGAYITLQIEKALFNKKNSCYELYCKNVIETHFSKSFYGKFQEVRALSRLHFKRLMYSWKKAGALLLALLSGSREYLDNNLSKGFRLAGLSHILALSGMHLSLFSSISFMLGKKSLGKKYAIFLELPTVLLFVWFAGRSPSLFRALLSCMILLLTTICRLKSLSLLNITCLTFLLHVIIFPCDIKEISFILSYGAVFGIVILSEVVKKPITRFIPISVSSGLSQSVGAQAFTMPVCARFFGFITPGGIISTLFVSPLVTIFIYLGLFAIIVSLIFPFFADIFGKTLSALFFCIEKSVFIFSKIPIITLK